MDNHRMQQLIRIYDEKINTPDPPHVFEARFAFLTADWIRSLDESDRAGIFEYIDYILHRPKETVQKQRTEMMLKMLADMPGYQTDSYKENKKWTK